MSSFPAPAIFPRLALALGICLPAMPACVYDLDSLKGKTSVNSDVKTPAEMSKTPDAAKPAEPDLEPSPPTDAGPTATDAAVDSPGDTTVDSTPDAPPGLPPSFPDRPAPAVSISPGAVGGTDLVAYWPLDEAQGMYAWDVTGHGNDGVLLLNAGWWPSGFPGGLFPNPGALKFDGITAYAESVCKTLPNIEAPKTVSLWARYDYEIDPLHPQALFVNINRTKSAGIRLEFRMGRLAVTGYFYKELIGIPAPPLGWHHIVYTYDGNSHVLYLDGAMAATSMLPSEVGPSTSPDGRCRIGRSSSGVDDAFRGFIDDVRIYKRPLNAAEVKSLFLGSP